MSLKLKKKSKVSVGMKLNDARVVIKEKNITELAGKLILNNGMHATS